MTANIQQDPPEKPMNNSGAEEDPSAHVADVPKTALSIVTM